MSAACLRGMARHVQRASAGPKQTHGMGNDNRTEPMSAKVKGLA